MPRSAPVVQPFVVANLDAGSFFIVSHATTSLDGKYLHLPDESAVYDVSIPIERLAVVQLNNRRGALSTEARARRLLARHIDTSPKRMYKLTPEQWGRGAENIKPLTGELRRIDRSFRRTEIERAELANFGDAELRREFFHHPTNRFRLAAIQEADITTRDDRHFVRLGDSEYDVTASVTPIVNYLAGISRNTLTPLHIGIPLVNGWHALGLGSPAVKPLSWSVGVRGVDSNAAETTRFVAMQLASARVATIEAAEQTFLERELESMRPPMDPNRVWPDAVDWRVGLLESDVRVLDAHQERDREARRLDQFRHGEKMDVLARNDLTDERRDELVARLERADVEFRLLGNEDPAQNTRLPRRPALVVAVPDDVGNDTRISTVLRPIGDNADLGRSRVVPGLRVAAGQVEWMTELGPVVVRKCSPVEWIDAHDGPEFQSLTSRRAVIAQSLVEYLDDLRSTWPRAIHEEMTRREIAQLTDALTRDEAASGIEPTAGSPDQSTPSESTPSRPGTASTPDDIRPRSHRQPRAPIPPLAPMTSSTSPPHEPPSVLGVNGESEHGETSLEDGTRRTDDTSPEVAEPDTPERRRPTQGDDTPNPGLDI